MFDYTVVESGVIAPHVCVITGEGRGPLVDTQRELRGWGRVYVSRRAVVDLARAFGLVKGPKAAELLDASGQLDEATRLLAAANKDRDQLRAQLEQKTREAQALSDDLADERLKTDYLRTAITAEIQKNQATLAGVTA